MRAYFRVKWRLLFVYMYVIRIEFLLLGEGGLDPARFSTRSQLRNLLCGLALEVKDGQAVKDGRFTVSACPVVYAPMEGVGKRAGSRAPVLSPGKRNSEQMIYIYIYIFFNWRWWRSCVYPNNLLSNTVSKWRFSWEKNRRPNRMFYEIKLNDKITRSNFIYL